MNLKKVLLELDLLIMTKEYNQKKNYTDDDVLLDAIMHLPLDSIISILQSAINPV